MAIAPTMLGSEKLRSRIRNTMFAQFSPFSYV
ncbi:hypothetical protein COLO4_11766 [Corchorus olitorius]|uniref:Uncharacterized protein n=1 Tax=Corchorus olitorius TaxID=93759 RepID=A0A1R3K3F3_9ROSI|nr:hypothetical protein COLO4_11766 [Corchorus olitorius]